MKIIVNKIDAVQVFNIGDKVKLKTGGVEMYILKMAHRFGFIKPYHNKVVCLWFEKVNGKNTCQTKNYNTEDLLVIQPIKL